MAAALDADRRDELEAILAELEGVLHAAIDPRGGTAWIVRDPGYDEAPVELAVRNQLAGLGGDAAALQVRLTLPGTGGPRKRVRFHRVERVDEAGRVTITVSLEWGGGLHTGSVAGERGPALELKTTAQAAIEALESLAGESLDLRIIGVKPIHAFDTDLMVASLYRTAGTPQRLVGAVVVSEDPLAAAAVAVLSAVNRTMGNFLQTPD